MSKCISVLGSTGSIGRQTLQVAEELGISQVQVSRLERSALKKVREMLSG